MAREFWSEALDVRAAVADESRKGRGKLRKKKSIRLLVRRGPGRRSAGR